MMPFGAPDLASSRCTPIGQGVTNRWSKKDRLGPVVSEQSILGVGFENPTFPKLGIESLRLSELLSRASPNHFARPQRPGFHLLLLFTDGCGDHFLDFRRVSCNAGTLIHARPGQVQQFVLGQTLEADILLFTPEFLFPAITEGARFGTLIDDVVPEGVAQLKLMRRKFSTLLSRPSSERIRKQTAQMYPLPFCGIFCTQRCLR